MFDKGILQKYTADVYLKNAQNMELPVSLMEFLTPNPWDFHWGFLFEILLYMMLFRGIGLLKSFCLNFS